MIFVPVRGTFIDGSLSFKLNKPLNSCMIGLLDFHLPKIDSKPYAENTIDLTCDQIDSTFWNPKRLLKRLCFNRVDKYDFYNLWEANIIEFHKLESAEEILVFNISRTLSHKTGDGAITYHNYSGYNGHEVFFTLVIKPLDSTTDRWICV